MRFLSKVNHKFLRGAALLRLDFNTEDDWRMQAVLPTIKFLLKRASKIVILSHKGRPRGLEKKWSLAADAKKLERYLRRKVVFVRHFRFAEIKSLIERAPNHSIFLLENLRFLPGEEKNDPNLAQKLASLGDFYVNDAFAVSHRQNASVVAITKFLPSYAGLEMEGELKHLSRARSQPKRPLVIVLGGGKAHDKLGVLRYFKRKARSFILGGAAANTILSIRGINVRNSLVDEDKSDIKKLRKVLDYKNFILPFDFKWKNSEILDIGPLSISYFVKIIKSAKTVIWSGPLGLIEERGFEKGTLGVARAIAHNKNAFKLAGGGETVMFIKKYGLGKKFTFLSTGGGAMLDFLAGESLPGIEALK